MAAAALVSCQRERDDMGHRSGHLLIATIESGETKTMLTPAGDDVYYVLWSEGDQIGVFTDDSQQLNTYDLSEGAGTKKGSFKGNGQGSKYLAYFPASGVLSRNGADIEIVLPSTQAFKDGTFASGSFPMAAAGTSSNLTFHNLCSILHLSVTGHHYLDSIAFLPKDKSMKVSGRGSVTPESFSLTMSAQGSDRVSLVTSGVGLNEESPMDFYLVIPPGTYKGGFTVRFYAGSSYMDKSFNEDFTFVRSQIHTAGRVQYKQEGGVDISEALEGKGTKEDPFKVSSLEDLLLMQAAVNAGGFIKSTSGEEVEAKAASYRLTCDIDLSPVCSKESGKSWKPIGDGSDMNWPPVGTFDGNFYGDGHKITNLYVNEEWGRWGLFGMTYYGGVISNLSVSGSITSVGLAGLVAATAYGEIIGCKAEGEVNVTSAGGIVGCSYTNVLSCVNYASINGEYAGGIAYSGMPYLVRDCINEGSISGAEYAGGIIAFLQYGGYPPPKNNFEGCVMDCVNYGSVSSDKYAGGIAGHAWQGAFIFNSINYGDVNGGQFVGGITGALENYNAWDHSANIGNCVNAGVVTANGTEYIGGICGYNQGEDSVNGYYASEVTQNYWLWDESKNLGLQKGIGVDEGKSSKLFPLTEAEMKGAQTSVALLGTYTTVLDALNSWANKHASDFSFPFMGWEYDADENLVFTGLDAVRPGEDQEWIKVSKSLIELSSYAQEFEITVTSKYDFSIRLPEWVSQKDEEVVSYAHTFVFSVSANEGESSRSGDIVFTNTDGQSVSVKLEQSSPYLRVMPESLPFVADGDTKRIAVASSVRWKASCAEDWCTISPDKGEANGTIFITVIPNTDGNARDAMVKVISEDGTLVSEVSVHQYGKHPQMTVSSLNVTLASQGDRARVTVLSNVDWKVTSSQEWCLITPESGSGDGIVTVSAGGNESEKARSAEVLISSADGSFEYKVSVVQSGKVDEGEQGDWKTQPFHHQSLAMCFTATWCGYCPMMHNAIDEVQQKYPDKLQHLALHTSGSNLVFSQNGALENLYGITGFPMGVVDGRVLINNYSVVSNTVTTIENAMLQTEQNYETITGMAIGSKISGQSVSVDVKAYLKSAGKYKITVLLVEDSILDEQSDNVDGDHSSYVHDDVARMSLTDVLGDAFSVSDDFSVKDFHYEVSVPADYVLQNMRVFAYIYAEFGDKPVIQSSSNYGDYYIDNCATTPLGINLSLALEGGGSGGTGGGGNEGINPGDDIIM